MVHQGDDEAKECQNVLDDEELVVEIAERSHSAEIHPQENGIRSHACQNNKLHNSPELRIGVSSHR